MEILRDEKDLERIMEQAVEFVMRPLVAEGDMGNDIRKGDGYYRVVTAPTKHVVSRDTLCDIIDRCRGAGGVLHVREIATEMYEIWYEIDG